MDRQKPYIQTELLVQHLSILRNKQCMLAYLMYRARKLQELRWELSSETLPEEIASCLSPQEKRFKDDYNQILRQYMSDIGIDLTLVRFRIAVLILPLRDTDRISNVDFAELA